MRQLSLLNMKWNSLTSWRWENLPLNVEIFALISLSLSLSHSQTFGNSFLRPDITLFKQNLSYLESLNTKHKLYSKVIGHLKDNCGEVLMEIYISLQIQFSSCMLYPFLQLLLQVLVQKSHDLLQDEICSSIYSMAAVNFTAYHQQFLAKFLTSIGGLSEEQQQQLVANYKMVEVKIVQSSSGSKNIIAEYIIVRHCLGGFYVI